MCFKIKIKFIFCGPQVSLGLIWQTSRRATLKQRKGEATCSVSWDVVVHRDCLPDSPGLSLSSASVQPIPQYTSVSLVHSQSTWARPTLGIQEMMNQISRKIQTNIFLFLLIIELMIPMFYFDIFYTGHQLIRRLCGGHVELITAYTIWPVALYYSLRRLWTVHRDVKQRMSYLWSI